MLALLRKCIGSSPVIPVALKTPPEITMTDWLNASATPAGFELEDEVELRRPWSMAASSAPSSRIC